jgi:dTMP kinase
MKARGVFVTFEGVEGSGKTTQMVRLGRWLRQRGHAVELTREPDGTALGAGVRRLFERGPAPLAQTFLFLAARHQHVTEKIRPWLASGRIVVCDRYTDATLAYQGHAGGIALATIRELNMLATGGIFPDLTLLFDLDPAEGFRRIGRRRLDHFERQALAFHRRVRRGYLDIQRAEPKRVRLLDASRSPAEVGAEVRRVIDELLRGA